MSSRSRFRPRNPAAYWREKARKLPAGRPYWSFKRRLRGWARMYERLFRAGGPRARTLDTRELELFLWTVVAIALGYVAIVARGCG